MKTTTKKCNKRRFRHRSEEGLGMLYHQGLIFYNSLLIRICTPAPSNTPIPSDILGAPLDLKVSVLRHL